MKNEDIYRFVIKLLEDVQLPNNSGYQQRCKDAKMMH